TIEGDIMDEILEKLAREAEADNEEALARSYGARKRRREAHAREEGRLSGLRDGLWLIVELRALAGDDRQRALVEACASSEQLSRWLARLKTAERFADALRD